MMLFGTFLMFSTIYAQVGIGTTKPHSSAVLELKSENAGLILPRLATSKILDPQMGTIIYNTELNQICVYTTKWECYPNSNSNAGMTTMTLIKQSAFLNLNGTYIFGNGLKNQNASINPSTRNVTPFVSPCDGGCDASSYGMVVPGNHVLGFSLRKGNASVSGNYVILRALVNGVVVNEETFNFPNMNTGDVVPFQFRFTCSSQAQIQIQAGNNLNDAGIMLNYLQTKTDAGAL